MRPAGRYTRRENRLRREWRAARIGVVPPQSFGRRCSKPFASAQAHHTNPHSARPKAPAKPANKHSATIAAAVGRGLSVRWQGRLSYGWPI